MDLTAIIFIVILALYIPVQIAFLVGGILLLWKSRRVWWKIVLGVLCLIMFGLMLPFTQVMAGLLYLTLTGGSFGP